MIVIVRNVALAVLWVLSYTAGALQTNPAPLCERVQVGTLSVSVRNIKIFYSLIHPFMSSFRYVTANPFDFLSSCFTADGIWHSESSDR